MMQKILTMVAAGAMMACIAVPVNASDPIPGIDIILNKEPDETIEQTTTGENGNFAFKNIPAGKYVVRILPSKFKTADQNSTRSNRSSSIGPAGEDVIHVLIEFTKDRAARSVRDEAIKILVTSKHGGKITGQVTRESQVTAPRR